MIGRQIYVDPLSSGGVSFALRGATAGAAVLRRGDHAAYQSLVSAEARKYRRLRSAIYGWVHRFIDSDFWRVRAQVPT